MIKFVFLISALVFFAKPTIAHDLKLELVDDIIQVNAGFHGDKLSILGTKMQDTNILISVQGPPKKIVIRKKEKIWGAWVNKSSYVFEQTPSFYRVASNLSDLSGYMDLLSGDDALLASSLRKIKSKADSQTKYQDFEVGLKNNMEEKSLYDAELHDIEYINNDFFRWDVYFPANVPTGTYKVRAILFSENTILRSDVQTLNVVRFGSNALIYGFAEQYSFLYGLLCVVIAICAGWGINVMRKRT